MNVVIVNDNAHVNGGAARVAIQEAGGLADRGPKSILSARWSLSQRAASSQHQRPLLTAACSLLSIQSCRSIRSGLVEHQGRTANDPNHQPP